MVGQMGHSVSSRSKVTARICDGSSMAGEYCSSAGLSSLSHRLTHAFCDNEPMRSRFAPEPQLAPGQPERTGILLCNLGTPDAATPSAVRRYLAQFLSDDRVVEIPKLAWWPILHGIILRTRPKASAAKYATVWNEGGATGSPLLYFSERQAQLLMGYLGEAGQSVLVAPAMRYGAPSIPAQLDALKAQGATRILVLPLYPQYSGTTTASVCDAVYD